MSKKISIDACLKNLIWGLFEFSHNTISGCGRAKANFRKELFNYKIKYITYGVSLSKDLLTINITTTKNNTIGQNYSNFKYSVKKWEEECIGLDIEAMNKLVYEVGEILAGAKRLPRTKIYTFTPDNLDGVLDLADFELKETLLDFVFPNFVDYLDDTYVDQSEFIGGFNKYVETKAKLEKTTVRLREQAEVIYSEDTTCIVSGDTTK